MTGQHDEEDTVKVVNVTGCSIILKILCFVLLSLFTLSTKAPTFCIPMGARFL